jgi:AcrR family transcriptional regulator
MAEAGEGRQPRSGGQAGLRARKKARTRAAIEDAALRLFLERGYAATTIDEIAAAVEVSPRTVLRYFASKEEVLFSRERETVRTLGALLAARSPQEPLLLAARAALTQLAAAYDATRERRLSWAHLVRGTPALAGAYLELLAGFEDAVAGFAAGRGGPGGGESSRLAGRGDPQERQGVRPRLQAALIVAAFRVALERWEGADGDLALLVAEHLDLLDSDLWQ